MSIILLGITLAVIVAEIIEPSLNTGQLLLIGFIATLLAQGLKLLFARLSKPLTRDWVTGVAFVASIALAYAFMPKPVETMTDPMQMATYLLEQSSAVLGSATLIYNVILEKIFDKFGWTKEDMTRIKNKS